MRVGLATSLVAHVVLIALGVIGLQGAEKLEPMAVEAISVDLVPIEEMASIRAGSEQSEVIETPAPAAIDTPKPASPAERPGATEKDQPIPEQTQTPSPAPTVQTAPEPVPALETPPAPKPEDSPPPPAPEPQKQPDKPAEIEPDPVLAAAPTPDETAAPAPPAPAMRTAAMQVQKPVAATKPTPKPQTPAETPTKTKPADKISDIINTEASRGSTTGSGGQAAAGKPSGQAARLTQSELGALIAQMRACWNPTLSERNDGVIIRLMVAMNTDGTVSGTPQILTDTSISPLLGISARTAARKVETCGPFDLPADKYDHWREIDVTLDASQAN